MFICGKDFDDSIQLIDDEEAEEALREFKEVDLNYLFSDLLRGEKIIDIAIGGNWPEEDKDSMISCATESGRLIIKGPKLNKLLSFNCRKLKSKDKKCDEL